MRMLALLTLTFSMFCMASASHAESPNQVPNPHVEEWKLFSKEPAHWSPKHWGVNTAQFAYSQSDGHGDTSSLKLSVTAYESGDAKWAFKGVTVSPGESYHFIDWYKSSTESYVVVDFLLENGEHFYHDLGTAERSKEWQKYEEYFEVPEAARLMTVFHLLRGVGELSIDDFSLRQIVREGFKRPLISITFDDGLPGNMFTAVPILKRYGLSATFYFATEFLEETPFEMLTPTARDALVELDLEGHEIGAHSVTHADLTTVSAEALRFEVLHSKEYLESLVGMPISNFATPYGAYNSEVIDALEPYYRSHRSVDEGFNLKDGFDPYRLVVQNVLDTTTLEQVRGWITQAKRGNAWLILVYHRVTQNPGEFNVHEANFASHMQAIAYSGVVSTTMSDALDEIMSQID